MKRFLLCILIPLSSLTYSQQYANIVADPSLEGFEGNCYLGTIQYNIDSSFYWQNGNDASTDYFGRCMGYSNWQWAYPDGAAGYQFPRTGYGMAGTANIATSYTLINYREYLQTKLLIPLEAGKKYVGEFYLNLAQAGQGIAVNTMGMLLTTTRPEADSIFNPAISQMQKTGVIDLIPQILSDTTYNIIDTLGWVLVRDTFIAQGGEEWLTIGNFRDNSTSIIFETGYAPIGFDSLNYYFIDDVSLYCIDTGAAIVYPTAFMQLAHSRKCQNDTIFLNDASAGSPDSWQWSASGGTINSSSQQNTFAIFSNPGTYTVQLIVSKSNGTSDTTEKIITVDPYPNVTLTSSNLTVCAGWHVQLTAAGANTYTWSMGGATTATKIVAPTTTTTYSVVGMNTLSECLSDTESITIQVIQGPTFNLASDTVCSTQAVITLGAQPPGGSYSGPGIAGNQFDPQVAGNGTYQLIYNFTNSSLPNCIGMDTAYITVETCPIGIEEVELTESIQVYPNPVKEKLTIALNAFKNSLYEVKIIDLLGKTVYKTLIGQSNSEIDVNSLTNGMYFLLINNSKSKKFIIEH